MLEQHVDVVGQESADVLRLTYLNGFHQTGLRNLLDRAVLEHRDIRVERDLLRATVKIDEVPFDFMRKRMSVAVAGEGEGESESGKNLMICKGAVEEMLRVCNRVRIGGEIRRQILTGDNDIVTRKVCRDVGLPVTASG